MDRTTYLYQDDIRNFVTWLVANLPTMPVHLKFRKSRNYVPDGLDKIVTGIQGAQACYQWAGDWATVSATLKGFRQAIRLYALAGDDAETYTVCREILKWGGVDNASTISFLDERKSQRDLAAYLLRVEPLLVLDRANRLSDITEEKVPAYNSGLTKIHALFDTTGSPIYDGRVGAAIATLYHLYRETLIGTTHPPADHRQFAMDAGQGCQIRDPRLLGLGFAGTPILRRQRPAEWARRQVQLGWIMRDVLDKSPNLFSNLLEMNQRCHCFEAGLFMMGYDLRALVPGGWQIPEPRQLVAKRESMRKSAAKHRARPK
ncbi:hypothetical protein HX866_06450 [Pseudomonas gingeri]|uniref:hypothetical protein n=1 Tax=Pseudomonas gingeri TaxID=117681 RepID=UPI0015A24B52|nr:hypothetical protein [Pseudomonas gingeri]NWA24525.1 hypothetical protein [Pseudomonas gingeri]